MPSYAVAERGLVKATLIVPTYNRAERLRALLTCATRQSAERLVRVVVCDDGSSDHTAEVVASFEGQLPIVHAHQPDLGFRAGQARNMGIERAIGDVAIFADDDVLFAPDFVEAHLAAHEARRGACVALGLRYRKASHTAGMLVQQDIDSGERDDRIADLDGQSLEHHESPWSFVYSCNFSVTLGGPELYFDEGFEGWGMEDVELGYRLANAGYQVFEAPAARVLHIDDPAPRDPFRCEVIEVPASYDSYVHNAVYFLDKFPEDAAVAHYVRNDLRWFVQDEEGRWVKNGYENDVESVIANCRALRRRPSCQRAAEAPRDSA